MRAPTSAFDDRRQRIDEQARQDAGDQAERGEEEHRRERKAVGLVRAAAAAGVRGRPRNVTPNALTKQAAASAADSASSAPTAGTRNFRPHDGSCGLSRIAWKVSHSETKPLSGGSAEMPTQPTRNTNAVCGMRWMSPPRCSMSRSPVAVSTAPAPKNSRLLNSE